MLAENMRNIANKVNKEKEENDFPKELYNLFIEEIQETAKAGNYSIVFPITDIKDQKEFLNFQLDFKKVAQKLKEEGFSISTNIYDPFAFKYSIAINWK